METIELYKKRKLNEIMTDSFNFIQRNALVLFKNLALAILPIALIQTFVSLRQVNSVKGLMGSLYSLQDLSSNSVPYFQSVLTSTLISLAGYAIIYSICAAIMLKDESGALNPKTNLKDLKGSLIAFAPNTLSVLFICMLAIAAVAFFFGSLAASASFWFLIPLVVVIILLIPPLSLTVFPLYFKNTGIKDALIEGSKTGWKKKGSILAILLISTLLLYLVNSFLAIPYYISFFLGELFPGDFLQFGFFNVGGIISYITLFISIFGNLLLIPFIFIPLALQYCSGREELEGVSMVNEVEHFENIE